MEVKFKDPMITGFNPDGGNLQYYDICPDYTLPKGKVFVNSRGIHTIPQALSKGISHIEHHKLDWSDYPTLKAYMDAGKTYTNVPQNQVILELPWRGDLPEKWVGWGGNVWPYLLNQQMWPTGPLTRDEAIAAANRTGIVQHCLHVGETNENVMAASPHWPFWGWFYERLAERYAQKWDPLGIPWYICHDYLTLGQPAMYYLKEGQSRQWYKDAYNAPISQWPTSNYSPGGTLSKTNLVTVPIYLGRPDKQSQLIRSIWFLECFKKLGYNGIMFLTAMHDWRPNNHNEVRYPDGKFYRQVKQPIDPIECINYIALGLVHSIGSIVWGSGGKVKDRLIDPDWPAGDLWFPTGTTVPTGTMPHYGRGTEFYGYSGLEDLLGFGNKMFADTWGLTVGGTRKFLKFRIRPKGGEWGAWHTPSQVGLNELVDADFDERGYMYSEVKGNYLSVYYLNQFAGGMKHDIEFEHPTNPSIIYNSTVCTNLCHMATFTF